METCYKDGKLTINNLSKSDSFGVEDIHITYVDEKEEPKGIYKTPCITNEVLKGLKNSNLLELWSYIRKQQLEDGYVNFMGWLNPYSSLGEDYLYILNEMILGGLEPDIKALNYLLSRHYAEFKYQLMKWAFSLNMGKVVLYNAKEALYTTQDKFDLDEKVFMFKASTFMEKGKLTKFKNIARVDVRHKIVKASIKEEPIYIVKFTNMEAENLVTRYKEEVNENDFEIYSFVLMLLGL